MCLPHSHSTMALSFFFPTQLLLDSSQPFQLPSKSFIFNLLITRSPLLFLELEALQGQEPRQCWHRVDPKNKLYCSMEEGKEEKERKIAYLLEFVSLINCRKLGGGASQEGNCILECWENSTLGFPSRKYLRAVNLSLTFAPAYVTADSNMDDRCLGA